MSQDENKLQECEPTNIIDDPKVSETLQLSSEPVNVVEKVPANVIENELANAVEKNFKPQLSSDNNVAVEVSEDNYEHRQQYTMSKTQIYLVFVGLSLAIFLASLDQTIIATALPAIALEFKALDQISWVGTAYLLTATAFQPSYGKLSDIFGRKPVFLAAIFLFELGSLLCGLSVNMIMLIISRAIAGVGGGGLIGMVYIIISEIVPIKDRGKYQGMMGGCFGIASVVGPLLGGAFTDKVTWRWSFFINLPLGVITFISVVFLLHLPSPTGSFWAKLIRIDWWGAFTLVVATILLLLPLNWAGSKYAWSDPIIIVLLCLGVHLFKNLKVAACFSINLFHGMAFFALLYFVPLYFQVIKSESATTSGLELLPLILSIVIMAISAGQLVSRTVLFSYGAICIFGSILMIVGSGLTITFSEYSSRGQIAGYLLISGLGIGLILQMTVLAGQGIVEHKNLATVTSLLTFFRTMGAVFGVAILGTVFNNVFDSNLPPQLQGSLQGFDPTTTGQASPFIIHDFVIALDAAFKVVIVFSGLTFISSLPLITVKPHRDNIQDENMLSLA
ncbi:MFS general substrate transporter [Gigaspora margarita]|uniref:MFS-type drug efflux transporter P55 n=1 Tax=Gigaspora margarita TaxID=4874 RepID=A0A8H3XJ12_GIGMA|nr:MFS general substrate transporter [Gigaspora margarita]